MIQSLRSLSFVTLIFGAVVSEARVFNFNSESFAAYLKGSIYPGRVENTLHSESHGADSTMDSYVPYNLSGEFGFVYATPRAQFRFGMEIIRPSDKEDEPGTDASGTVLFTRTSELTILVPKVGFDVTLKSWPQDRIYMGATVGYASLAARNSYKLTAAGTTEYGIGEFYEDLRGGAPQYEGFVGYERMFTDATTFGLEGGYRNLVFKEIKHNNDVTTFQGPVEKGDAAKNDDGSDRSLNMNQFHIGLNLRFWIH